MKRAVSAAGVLITTLAWFLILVSVHPFDRVSALLDSAFDAPPAWTNVELLARDPETQELSRGEHPLESFAILSKYWAAHPVARRILFIGNSQMQSVTLAPGEAPYSEPAKTYVDLVADLCRQDGRFLVYRLSAGGLSYEEALWYVYYLFSVPELKPDVIMLQINYQFFAQGGIREGMLELLKDDRFRQRIEQVATAGQPYSESFAQSLTVYRSLAERAAPAATVSSSTGASPAAPSGNAGLAGKLERGYGNGCRTGPSSTAGNRRRSLSC
jgi:hypothetical protein